MGEARMKKLKGQQIGALGYRKSGQAGDPTRAPYERRWDDEHKPSISESVALLAAANVAKFHKIPLEDAMTQIQADFDVVMPKIRIRDQTIARAGWAAAHDQAELAIGGEQ